MTRVGQVLGGKYEVTRLLGRGGMGEVWAARHKQIGKEVAIKLLRQELAGDEELIARFAQEARAASAVGHRGIVDIYDVGTADDGAPYLVMELLDGCSLRTILKARRRLPEVEVVAIMLELLSALSEAHDKGILHRDLKPDNVFVERSDTGLHVKLLDFGIAKMTEKHDALHLTAPGKPLGTVQYMSPEQARGKRDLDARVDVWAVGVLMYEALCGTVPFESDYYHALLAQIMKEEPRPLRDREPSVSPQLERIVQRAMSKERDDRQASAAELREALQPFARLVEARTILPSQAAIEASGVSPSGPTIPMVSNSAIPRRRPALPIAFVTVAVLALGWMFWPDAESPPPRRPRPPPARAVREASAAPEPAPAPEEVTVRLEGVPRGARVTLDGALVPALPIRLAPRRAMLALRVEADGHEPFAQMIVPDRNQTIQVSLAPTAAPPSPLPPQPRRPRAGTKGDPPGIQTDTGEFD